MAKGASEDEEEEMYPEDEDEGQDIVEVEEVEEDDEEEEEEEEEEEKVVKKRSKKKEKMSPSDRKRARARRKKEMAKRRTKRIVGSVIAMVIVLSLLWAYIYNPAPSSITLTIFDSDPEYNPNSGLDLLIDAKGGGIRGYNGPVTLSVSINGSTTYTTDLMLVSGVAKNFIKYSEFLTENGKYTIKAEAEGIIGTVDYQLKNVVEDITYTKNDQDYRWMRGNEQINGGKTNLTMFFTLIRYTSANENTTVIPQPEQFLDIEVTTPSGNKETKQASLEGSPTYQFNYLATVAGEYTIRAIFKNTHIRSDSVHWTIIKTITLDLNARPFAEAGPDQTHAMIPLIGEVKVTVDASASFDDGEIVSYVWNFGVYTDGLNDPNYGKDVVTSDQPTAEWTYTETGDYTVTLSITDDGIPGSAGNEKTSGDFLLIHIN